MKKMKCCRRSSGQTELRTGFKTKSEKDISVRIKSQVSNLNRRLHSCALKPTLQKHPNNDNEPKHFPWLCLKVPNANRLRCLRACPASRVCKAVYETLTLTPIPRVSECVRPVWLMVV